MDYPIITLLFVIAIIGLSQQQLGPARCLFSRLDFMPCRYQSRKLIRAGDNEYTIHYTRLGQSQSGGIECNVRVKHQQIRNITTCGTEDMKIIHSPGFFNGENYDDQLLVEYKVKCGADQLAFFKVICLDLEPETCIDEDGNPKCSDYILIDRGTGGTTEICGNTPGINSMLELQIGEFKVFFRTSEENTHRGFVMYIICFQQSEADLEGCLRPEDFNCSVCNAVNGSRMNENGVLYQENHTTTSPICNRIPDLEFSEEAVFLVLRNLEACNPVLRSQARSSLAFYRANETRAILEQLLNFTITCTSNTTTFVCTVDEGFAPALDLPHSTYCTFNFTDTTNEPLREQCNPFYGGVDLTCKPEIISITVEAINCNGQRVKIHNHIEIPC